jgi:hypothetical protein
MSDQFVIDWMDRNREPQNAPDPDYPDGIDLDIARGRIPSCVCKLPYPAARCGLFYIECHVCGTNIIITTAGRPDDPRSVRLPCETHKPKSL